MNYFETNVYALLTKCVAPQLSDLQVRLDLDQNLLQPEGAERITRATRIWELVEQRGTKHLMKLKQQLLEMRIAPKPDYRYYLSYDRNLDPALCQQFHQDLEALLHSTIGCKARELGFFGEEDAPPQGDWLPWSEAALQECDVFLFLHSIDYCHNDYCGKEYAVFCQRQQRYEATSPQSEWPPLVVWIPWDEPTHLEIPPGLENMPIPHRPGVDHPFYTTRGLRHLVENRAAASKEEYVRFLEKLVHFIRTGRKYRLPRLGAFPPLRDLTSWFDDPTPPRPKTVCQDAGLGVARIVYVVGRRGEIESVRTLAGTYDAQEGSAWRPFDPPTKETIDNLAKQAVKDDFSLDPLPLEGNLIEKLQDAQRTNVTVILLVDGWSLLLQKFRYRMEQYDQTPELHNTAVLILISSNPDDRETARMRLTLETAVDETFATTKKDQGRFVDSISSRAQFLKQLKMSLNTVRGRVVESSATKHKAVASEEVSQPHVMPPSPRAPQRKGFRKAKGEQVIQRPSF